MLILISPIEVVISHIPPLAVFGTSIFPVLVLEMKIFSLRSVPVTSPVEVSMMSSSASEAERITLPVVLTTDILPEDTTLQSDKSPVVAVAVKSLQVTFVKVTSPVVSEMVKLSVMLVSEMSTPPVEREMSSEPACASFTVRSPVLKLILHSCSVDAPSTTSPVLSERSRELNLKVLGIFGIM